jgi:uroporphyrin-III C-methyltransferase
VTDSVGTVQPGTVWIVGAGPGDPELLTLKALRALESADVVLYDRLVSREVLELIPVRVERIFVGKSHGEQDSVQAEIMTLLVEHAMKGKTVVRLKGGDPFVFGRGAEEWAWLREHDIPVSVVPGISSSLAVPALAGIPLTYRGVARNYAVMTGHRAILDDSSPEDWRACAGVDTLVILMGVGERRDIATELIRAGRASDTPCAFVERGSTPSERVLISTLEVVAAGGLEVSAPAVWVIGAVVKLRSQLVTI